MSPNDSLIDVVDKSKLIRAADLCKGLDTVAPCTIKFAAWLQGEADCFKTERGNRA